MKRIISILILIQLGLVAKAVTVDFVATNACFGAPIQFTGSCSLPDNQIASWNWDMNNDGVFTDALGKSISYTFQFADTFKVSLQIITFTNEVYTTTAPKTVLVYPIPVAHFLANNACFMQPTTFTNKSAITTGTIASCAWDFNNDGKIDNTSFNPTYIYPTSGSFTAKLSVLSDNGCTNTTSLTVNVNQNPLADFTFEKTCLGDVTHFSDLSLINIGSIISHSWSFGDQYLSSDVNPDHQYSNSGNYTVSLIAISDNNCRDTVTYNVLILANPVINLHFNPDSIVYGGTPVYVKTIGNYASKLWSNNSSADSIIINQAGSYSVAVTDFHGCKNERTFDIVTKAATSDIVANNVMTPNGDGINDNFIIKLIDGFYSVEIKIFDAWGNAVYSSSNYKNDWDGTSQGKVLPAGPYYYWIKANDIVYKGCVNILR